MLGSKKGEDGDKPAAEPAKAKVPESAPESAYETTPATPQPGPSLPGIPEIPRRLADIPPISRPAEDGAVSRSENKRLTVGKDIEMSGEITTCELLVVEGSVDANLRNGREIQIARTGRFSGSAEVEEADISGEFSGKLVVHQRLIVRAGGKVDGEIFYGKIQVEPGGQVTGQLTAGDEHASEIQTLVGADQGGAGGNSGTG